MKLPPISPKGAAIVELAARLQRIAEIISRAEQRAMAVDGPVSATREHITEDDLRQIWRLAIGKQASRKAGAQ